MGALADPSAASWFPDTLCHWGQSQPAKWGKRSFYAGRGQTRFCWTMTGLVATQAQPLTQGIDRCAEWGLQDVLSSDSPMITLPDILLHLLHILLVHLVDLHSGQRTP